jgi:hypothetical protein
MGDYRKTTLSERLIAGSPRTEASTPNEEEILALLRTPGLSIKNLDPATKEKVRRYVAWKHTQQGVSLGDIAKLIGNKTSGYTSWLTRQLGIQPREFEEARLKGIHEKVRKYERKPFDGTDEDKSFLLGIAHLTSRLPSRLETRCEFQPAVHIQRWPSFSETCLESTAMSNSTQDTRKTLTRTNGISLQSRMSASRSCWNRGRSVETGFLAVNPLSWPIWLGYVTPKGLSAFIHTLGPLPFKSSIPILISILFNAFGSG